MEVANRAAELRAVRVANFGVGMVIVEVGLIRTQRRYDRREAGSDERKRLFSI